MKTTVFAIALAVAPMMFAAQATPAKPADPAPATTTKVKKAKKQHVKKAPKHAPATTTTPQSK
jgi:hypothetical protein